MHFEFGKHWFKLHHSCTTVLVNDICILNMSAAIEWMSSFKHRDGLSPTATVKGWPDSDLATTTERTSGN